MKLIALTRGLFAKVDDDDYEALNAFKWFAQKSRNTFYAVRQTTVGIKRQKTLRMHRVILGLTDPDVFADHKDRSGLNNQRDNLRVCSVLQNNANRCKITGSISPFKGVSWLSRQKRWVAQVSRGRGKSQHIGCFKSEIEAARAYDTEAAARFGAFAKLNFP